VDANQSGNIAVDPFAPRIQDESILSDTSSRLYPDTTTESKEDDTRANSSLVASERDCEEVGVPLITSQII